MRQRFATAPRVHACGTALRRAGADALHRSCAARDGDARARHGVAAVGRSRGRAPLTARAFVLARHRRQTRADATHAQQAGRTRIMQRSQRASACVRVRRSRPPRLAHSTASWQGLLGSLACSAARRLRACARGAPVEARLRSATRVHSRITCGGPSAPQRATRTGTGPAARVRARVRAAPAPRLQKVSWGRGWARAARRAYAPSRSCRRAARRARAQRAAARRGGAR